MKIIKGEFEVKLIPETDDVDVGRMTIDKVYSGPLSATGKGQMLSFRSSVEGSAGYVAIEHVEANLDGKSGGFVLQHSGEMNRGKSSLAISIVPDSGSGDFKTISGSMEIDIKDRKHFYTLNYTM